MAIATFFKLDDGFQYVGNDKVYEISVEMMACMDRQYRMMGYMKHDMDLAVSYTKVEKNA